MSDARTPNPRQPIDPANIHWRGLVDAPPPDHDVAPAAPTPTHADTADDLARVETLLVQFEQLEAQLAAVRDSLMHSHRLSTLGTIATVIAHEFNNLLTPMISYGQLALAKPDDAELMRKAVERCLHGAERAAQISGSLLGFAREADQAHAAHLPTVVDDTFHALARDPRKDNIQLTLDVPDVLVAISAVNLQQVLLNLVINARHAMRRQGGGRLAITGRVQGSLIHLTVADTGPGVPPAVLDRLFEPFVTLRETDDSDHFDQTAKKGTGLGLTICRELVHNAGGSIHVDSEPGEGAAFHITLPKADDLFETT